MGSWPNTSRWSATRGDKCCVCRLDFGLCTFCRASSRTPPSVEAFLILESLVRLIVLLAPLVRLPAPMVLTASERTVEILPLRVTRMRQKANEAVAAADRTGCQTGMIAQDRIQRGLILTNNRTSAIVLMPIRAKCKEFPGGYDKNSRFSVKMLICSDTPSSYELDANASRARARFFCGSAQELYRSDRATNLSPNVPLARRTCAVRDTCARPVIALLGKKSQQQQD